MQRQVTNRQVQVIQPTLRAGIHQSTLAPVVKKRVAAYARVSTEHEEQQSSYEAQVDYYSISTPTPILAWLQIHRCSPTTRTVVDHTYLSHSTMTLIAVLVLLVVAKVFSTAPKLPYMFTARPTACKQKRTYASAYSTICVIDFRGHHGPGVCII